MADEAFQLEDFNVAAEMSRQLTLSYAHRNEKFFFQDFARCCGLSHHFVRIELLSGSHKPELRQVQRLSALQPGSNEESI